MRLKTALRSLPVWVGILAIVVPALVLPWNATIATAFPRLTIREKTPLTGVPAIPSAPEWSAKGFAEGSFQSDLNAYLTGLHPWMPKAVRLKGQFYYSVLGTSPRESIILGEQQQLYERIYVEEYCTRDISRFAGQAEAWVARLAKVQRRLERRGQRFLYVITPSKAAIYPEHLPRDYSCRASEADRTGFLAAYRALLDKHGVAYVDTASLLAAERDRHELPLFARGSIHWNQVAATLAAQATIARLNQLAQGPVMPTFTWSFVHSSPKGSDRDLLLLLNLMKPDSGYAVPRVEVAPAPQAPCRRARIAEVGGSFLMAINEALHKAACAPEIDYFFYFDDTLYRFPGKIPSPNGPEIRTDRLMNWAEIVILEENEQRIARSQHGPAFADLLEAGRP